MVLGLFGYGEDVRRLATDNARFGRSDGMAWTLHYLNKYAVPIDNQLADEVLGSRDCVALLMLYLSGDANHQANVVKFAASLDQSDLYELDQYWLLLYELFRAGAIASPYKKEDAFEVMANNSVSFV
jgi:hypothetical protein